MKKKYLHARCSLLVCFLSFGLFASCVNTRETLRSGWVLGEQQRSGCSIDLPHIGQSMRSRHIKKFPTIMFAGLTIFTAFVGLAYWGNIEVDHTIIEPYRNGSISPMI